jgi:hypothetical protein
VSSRVSPVATWSSSKGGSCAGRFRRSHEVVREDTSCLREFLPSRLGVVGADRHRSGTQRVRSSKERASGSGRSQQEDQPNQTCGLLLPLHCLRALQETIEFMRGSKSTGRSTQQSRQTCGLLLPLQLLASASGDYRIHAVRGWRWKAGVACGGPSNCSRWTSLPSAS